MSQAVITCTGVDILDGMPLLDINEGKRSS